MSEFQHNLKCPKCLRNTISCRGFKMSELQRNTMSELQRNTISCRELKMSELERNTISCRGLKMFTKAVTG